ncbi:MAG: ATP-binding cassette domain-containing protein [Treponema sp.]|nr:ATP-binding cassette domain-containing protein [Treponema sp.]
MTVTLRNICKQYPRKTVLDDISLEFASGQIHALFGQNGAGKSTLVNILSGSLLPDSGSIFLDGTEVSFKTPHDALAHGIVLVHQTPLLAPQLTAEQNIRLSIQKKITREEIQNTCTQWAPFLNTHSLVHDLSGNQRFYTALIEALLKKPKLLILDEPSAFLDAQERKDLYKKLRTLTEQHVTVIVITHSAAEASTQADTVTVLNEGKVQTVYKNARDFCDKPTFDIPHAAQTDIKLSSKPCFIMKDVSTRPKYLAPLFNINLCVDYGSITAVMGMQESALETLEELTCGMLSSENQKGSITVCSETGNTEHIQLEKKKLTARFLRRHKIAIVPSDRKMRGSNPELTVSDMLFCSPLDAETLIKNAQIDVTPSEKVRALSGGMLQRLILAREQSLDGSFFILCNPMQGLDVASQAALTSKIIMLAQSGKAVLILGAADIPLSICTRVYQMEEGTCTLAFQKNI